jgi:hypothetical protein
MLSSSEVKFSETSAREMAGGKELNGLCQNVTVYNSLKLETPSVRQQDCC